MSHVEVNSIVGEEAAVAKVEVYLDGHTFTANAVGTAKKHPNDPAVHAVGEALALSRALAEASVRLEEYAMQTNASHIEAAKRDADMKRFLSELGIED